MSDTETKAFPIKRQEELKWNGWGYIDSKMEYDPETNSCYFTGNRYIRFIPAKISTSVKGYYLGITNYY